MSVSRYLSPQLEADSQTQEVGIGAFTALARVSEQVDYKSQAPTTYLEDGSFAHDHIINEPLQLTIDGVVSDKYIRFEALPPMTPARMTTNLIPLAAQFIPARTTSQLQRIRSYVSDVSAQITAIDATLKGMQVGNVAGNLGQDSIMEKFVDEMERLHLGKQVIKISMPFRVYDSMVLTGVSWTRDNLTKTLQFRISAQKIRVAGVEYAEISKKIVKKSSISAQTAAEADKGTQAGEKKPFQSLAVKLFR